MDADSIKKFVIQHLEKFFFVLFALLSIYLVYAGLQKPNFLATEQPDKLTTSATQVKSSIDLDHTEAIIEERVPTFDIVAETKRRDAPVDEAPWKTAKFWQDVNLSSVTRRTDPQLPAPIDIRLHSVITSIAAASLVKDEYQLATLPAADKIEKEEAPVRPTPGRGRGRGRGRGMDMGMMDMGMMEMGMDSGMDSDMGMMEMGGMMGGPMGGSMANGPVRQLSPESDISGFRPVMQNNIYPVPAVANFIAGVALLPYEEIYDSFEEALSQADGYNPARDVPVYHDLQIQRADVTGKDPSTVAEEDWIQVWDRKLALRLASRRFVGFAPEITPADYREDALTFHIPPVLLDDYTYFSMHPKIPTMSRQEIQVAEQKIANPVQTLDILTDIQEIDDVLTGPGQMGNGGMMGGGMDMYGGDYGGYGAEAGYQGGLMIGQGRLEANPVEHKLIRFYDFVGYTNTSPKYGRDYIYRIRYGIVDPNFPQLPNMQPAKSTLDPETNRRVTDLVAEAIQKNSRDGLWIRYSEWSEPTDPIQLAYPYEYFAGPVNPGRTVQAQSGNRTVVVQRDQPSAEIVSSIFSNDLGTRIPMTMSVSPGSIVAGKAEAVDVVDPVTKSVKKLENASVPNPSLVVDISGGNSMVIDSEIKQPGAILMMNPDGSLNVADAVADQRVYRIYSFAEEKGK